MTPLARVAYRLRDLLHMATCAAAGLVVGSAGIVVLLTTTHVLTPATHLLAVVSGGRAPQLQGYAAVPVLLGILLASSMVFVLCVAAGGLRRVSR